VRVYVQRAEKYLDTTAWPPPSTTVRREYLASQAIATKRPAQSSASYVTNPAAGLSMSLDQQGTVAISPYLPLDQRSEEEQGLSWRTPTLSAPLTLAGPVALHLVASSTASDTDWFAKISDVAPDGSQTIVSEGQLRASLHALAHKSTAKEPLETLTSPEPLTPGQFYDYEISIAPTAWEFAAGHSLQVRLTSYNMPNALPATFGFDASSPASSSIVPLLPAINTVRLGGPDPTTLRLPISSAGESP
jgi:uncharacterized protein